MKIYKIRMITNPNFEKGGFIPNFKVICKRTIFYEYNESERKD